MQHQRLITQPNLCSTALRRFLILKNWIKVILDIYLYWLVNFNVSFLIPGKTNQLLPHRNSKSVICCVSSYVQFAVKNQLPASLITLRYTLHTVYSFQYFCKAEIESDSNQNQYYGTQMTTIYNTTDHTTTQHNRTRTPVQFTATLFICDQN